MPNQDEPANLGLQTLLDLDQTTYEVGGGYWVSMSVNRVVPDSGRPHGIQYALTLHAPGGERMLGYDNAHKPRTRSGPSRRSVTPVMYDHVHRGSRITPYEFKTPGDLLVDFWEDVVAMLMKEGVR